MSASPFITRALVRITFMGPDQVSVCAPGWDPAVQWTYSRDETTTPLFAHYADRNEHDEVRVFAVINLAAESLEELDFKFDSIEPVVPFLAR